MSDLLLLVQQLSPATKVVLVASVTSTLYFLVSLAVQLLAAAWFFSLRVRRSLKGVPRTSPSTGAYETPTKSTGSQETSGASLKSLMKAAGKNKRFGGPDRLADSELFIAGMRGHTDSVTGLAFSTDGLHLATACEDRTLRIFDLQAGPYAKTIPMRHFPLRFGVQDVAFGAQATQLTVLVRGTANAAGLCSVNVAAKDAEVVHHIPNVFSKKDTTALCLKGSMGSGASGNIPVVVAAAPTPELRVYAATAQLDFLGSIDTGGMQQYTAAVSSDGRFVAAATFTSDVKIYEVEYDRTGSFVAVKKAMDLMGHRKKVTAVGFSPDATKAVTASEDGTLRIWNISVRYKLQEDPKTLATAGLPAGKATVSQLAWGRSGHIAAVCDADVHLLDGRTGEIVETIRNAHGGTITDVSWGPKSLEGPQGRVYVLATAGDDGRVRLWRAPWIVA